MAHSSAGVLFFVTCAVFLQARTSAFSLTLLHTNDVHAHYEEMNKYGGRCPPQDSQSGLCYGGTARLATKVKEIRAQENDVLFLNAGDYYQGTLYFNQQTWNITSVFMNLLGYQAMCFGNHEFDNGVDGLAPLLDHVNFPVLACNVDVSSEPKLQGKFGCEHIFNYTENGKTEYVAVVGYITPETASLASPGPNVKFLDEIEALQPVVKKLRDSGINKIIGLGHSGVTKDQEIAEKVAGIDIIVGGHSHTFLYTGSPPSSDVPQGPYPIEVKRADGTIALVLQASCYGKYLGYVKVNFSDQGDIQSWEGQPILLDAKIPQDNESLEILAPYKHDVDLVSKTVVAQTGVLLRGDRLICRMMECNLGNLLGDAMVSHFRLKNFNTGQGRLSIAIWNSGGIRASIDEQINKGNITMEDIYTVAPFGNTIDAVDLPGYGIKNIMEHSVEHYDPTGMAPPGGFLQVSGMHVTYDLSKPPNSRVVSLKLMCNECRVPKYLPVNDSEVYTVAIPTYVRQGGDGFTSIKQDAIKVLLSGDLDTDIITQYLTRNSPVFTPVEERIVFLPRPTNSSPTVNDTSKVATTLTIIFFLLTSFFK